MKFRGLSSIAHTNCPTSKQLMSRCSNIRAPLRWQLHKMLKSSSSQSNVGLTAINFISASFPPCFLNKFTFTILWQPISFITLLYCNRLGLLCAKWKDVFANWMGISFRPTRKVEKRDFDKEEQELKNFAGCECIKTCKGLSINYVTPKLAIFDFQSKFRWNLGHRHLICWSSF